MADEKCERCGRPKWRGSRRRLCGDCGRRDRLRGAYAAETLAWLAERDRALEEMQRKAADRLPLNEDRS